MLKRWVCFVMVLIWPMVGFAGPLDQAEALILQNDMRAAHDVLDGYDPATPAEAERKLWARAVAYNRSGHPRKALPLLEKLVSIDPNSARYRLELAGALMAVDDGTRAQYHYSLLRGSTDDPSITKALDERLAIIDKQKSWEGFLSFALTPESNAARRTAADTVSIAGLPFVLNRGARAQSATGVRLAFGGALLPAIGPNTRARIGLSFDGRFFKDNEAPDDLSVIGQLGLVNFGDRARQVGATLHLAKRWIDGDEYSVTSGVTLNYSRLVGNAGALALSTRFQKVDFERVGVVSANETRLQLRYSHNMSPRFQLYTKGFVELRDSKLADQSGTNVGLAVGGQYLFEGGIQVALELERTRLERDGPNLLFGVRRKDDKSMATLRLLNRNWNAFGFTPVLELGIEKQRSSIPLYSYDNTRMSFGVTRRF